MKLTFVVVSHKIFLVRLFCTLLPAVPHRSTMYVDADCSLLLQMSLIVMEISVNNINGDCR